MNGWQRLWLVLTIICWFLLALIPSLGETDRSQKARWTYFFEDRVLKDYQSGKCADYINLPLSEIRDPITMPELLEGTEKNCGYIYQSRTADADEWGDIVPYTKEVFLTNKRKDYWYKFLGHLGILTVMVIIGSGLVYLAGFAVTWIRRGFGRN